MPEVKDEPEEEKREKKWYEYNLYRILPFFLF